HLCQDRDRTPNEILESIFLANMIPLASGSYTFGNGVISLYCSECRPYRSSNESGKIVFAPPELTFCNLNNTGQCQLDRKIGQLLERQIKCRRQLLREIDLRQSGIGRCN